MKSRISKYKLIFSKNEYKIISVHYKLDEKGKNYYFSKYINRFKLKYYLLLYNLKYLFKLILLIFPCIYDYIF